MNLKLTPFFKEVIELRWSEFVKLEKGEDHTSAQAVVLAIVRACTHGKLPAIKESLNRIDGKLQEQIEVQYPKFYLLYPHATALQAGKVKQLPPPPTAIAPPTPDSKLATGSLRDTLDRMSDSPKAVVDMILTAAKDVDSRADYASEVEPNNDPLVKSVIVAGLLKMAHNGSMGAIFEVFDNLDGKLVDVVRILGDDVYLTSYDTIAPKGAKKNKDGVYQLEADNTSSSWALKLGKGETR